MKQKSLEMVQVTVFFILMKLFLFGLLKTETGAKTAPLVPKLGYLDGWVPKLSSRVTLATSGAGVDCHIIISAPENTFFREKFINRNFVNIFYTRFVL